MKKNFIYTLAAAASLAAAMVSCADEEILSVETPTIQEREITVNLVQAETRTYIDADDASLHWMPGDEVMYWTCATASDNAEDWGESKTATISGASFTATVSDGQNYIRVVYPSTGSGKPYETPKVKQYQNYDTQWLLNFNSQIVENDLSPLQLAGKYLPMQTDIEEIPASNVVNAEYTVLGSVILFNVTAPENLTLKAIKAGDYQADFDYRGMSAGGQAIDDLPLNDCKACVVVPLGTDIEYTPTIFCKEWSSETEYTCQTFTRNIEKRSSFTTPKVQRLSINLNTNASQYTKTAGWKKATDIGLSVAWADMSFGCDTPEGINLMTLPTNDTWAAEQWGEGWRVPTKEEWEELQNLDSSTKTFFNKDGKNFLTITNNGASILFPGYGGFFNAYYGEIRDTDRGCYWSSSIRPAGTYYCYNITFSNITYSTYGYTYDRNLRLVRDIKTVESALSDPSTPSTALVDNGDGTGTLNGHAWVDLGIRTTDNKRLVFATCNIGAENPEDAGLYFWWGDIQGHAVGSNGLTTDNFSFGESTTGSWNNNTTEYLGSDGILKPEKDAATQLWGEGWRMGTKEEFESLISCTRSDVSSPVTGQRITSKKYSTKTIFIPRVGDVEGTQRMNTGYFLYWTSTPNYSTMAWRYMGSYVDGSCNRWNGYPIRPVAVIE